ncbi:hypothetical protein E4U17_002658 [Claviceps sp. LM77 group G4]|nr:hypothetical protein E4U17_002658 [Claviceps sp. LM77 group G4]KAG6082225.1 hypothetical protein E4U16_006380 [Claviceps sp. LM84 group G4]
MASPVPSPSPTASPPVASATPAPVANPSSSLATTTTAPLPPLTTPWTNPLSCTWTYVVDHPSDTATPGAVAFLDLEPMPGDQTLSCYPNGMFAFGRTGVFSPGTCPGGWTTASLLADDNTPATTTAVCCSYGYTYSGSVCRRSVATALAVPITYNTTAGTYKVLTASTTTLYSAMLAVSTIQVLFNEDDKKRLGIQTDTVNSGWSLSLGTRIGIAVGVGCFILLCMALIYYALARRRRFREGLTKERLIRDLKSIHRRNSPDNGPYINTMGMSVANAGPYLAHEQHDPPPPAYDPRSRGSVGNRPGDSIRPTEGEIRALNEQKAMIQQRLDELESLDIRRNGPRTGS